MEVELVQRIEVLERSVRRAKATTWVVLLVATGVLVAAAHRPEQVSDSIRVRRLDVVDDQGNSQISLVVLKDVAQLTVGDISRDCSYVAIRTERDDPQSHFATSSVSLHAKRPDVKSTAIVSINTSVAPPGDGANTLAMSDLTSAAHWSPSEKDLRITETSMIARVDRLPRQIPGSDRVLDVVSREANIASRFRDLGPELLVSPNPLATLSVEQESLADGTPFQEGTKNPAASLELKYGSPRSPNTRALVSAEEHGSRIHLSADEGDPNLTLKSFFNSIPLPRIRASCEATTLGGILQLFDATGHPKRN